MTRNLEFATRPRGAVHPALMSLVFIGAVLIADAGRAHAGPAETRVFLNGKPVAVHFNDGDSFRVLRGRMKGAKARIAGFNTLESHGPVHQWGDWTSKEMYVLAKMATLRARRGTWHCTTDGKLDTYGRMLTHCPELGEDLIRAGLAHALTVTDNPAVPAFLHAQKQAQAARRGIWAHGIPAFIVTSVHSVEEDTSGHGTYNRTVSTDDGHSVMWRHTIQYKECQTVCKMKYPAVDDTRLADVVGALKADPGAAESIAGLSDDVLMQAARDYATYRHVDREVPSEHRWELIKLFKAQLQAGTFGPPVDGTPVSCMVHIPFKRRYGNGKAACLK